MEKVTTTTSNEGVLVVLQTENGEQIALPMSALPSDFVPGDSEQLIMVEVSPDEQHQEVVVESSDISTTTTTSHTDNQPQQQELQSDSETLVTVHDNTSDLHHHQLAPADPITLAPVSKQANATTTETRTVDTTATIISEDQFKTNNSNSILSQDDIPMVQLQPLVDSPSKTLPRTYGRTYGSNVGWNIKSYAPTCGVTRIYQQVQPATPIQQTSQDEEMALKTERTITINSDEMTTTTASTKELSESPPLSSNGTATTSQSESVSIEAPPPPKKQKRKEPLLTKPLNEEDMELKFHIMEEPLYGICSSPEVQKERKRKEYKTKKKIKLAMEKLASEKLAIEELEVDELEEETPAKEKPAMDRLSKDKSVAEKQVKERLVLEKLAKETPIVERPAKEKRCIEKQAKEKLGVEKLAKDKMPTVDKPTREKVLTEKSPKEKLMVEKLSKNILAAERPVKERRIKTESDSSPVERRTRLSNSCRVATGKSYKCNDCEYSTERINNIILHIKEKHVSHK